MIAWQEGDSLENSQTVVLMNLNTGVQKRIEAKASETIVPIGFIEEDLIYGIVNKNDIVTDYARETVLPM